MDIEQIVAIIIIVYLISIIIATLIELFIETARK